jgi:hypothetical protein
LSDALSDALGSLVGAAGDLLRDARRANIAYLLWGVLHDAELEYARAAMADLADQDLRHDAAMRRGDKLRAIGSEATFFSGLARIDGEFRSVRVAVTPQDFVLFDNWTHLHPDTELACLPRDSMASGPVRASILRGRTDPRAARIHRRADPRHHGPR